MTTTSRTFRAQPMLSMLFPATLALASVAAAAQSSGAPPNQAKQQPTAQPAKDAGANTASTEGESAVAAAELGPVEQTLRAQVLLERAHFSAGVIDGQTGGNTRRALRAYQSAHGLPVTG
nr:peptidoglycan-binding protein [Pseudomonadota bacterium]